MYIHGTGSRLYRVDEPTEPGHRFHKAINSDVPAQNRDQPYLRNNTSLKKTQVDSGQTKKTRAYDRYML